MSLYFLDTDMMSLWQHGHASVTLHVAAHSALELGVTVITVQEQLDGWHLRLNRAKDRKQTPDLYQRLTDSVRFLSRLQIFTFSVTAIVRYEELRKQKLSVGKMDLRTARGDFPAHAALISGSIQTRVRNSGCMQSKSLSVVINVAPVTFADAAIHRSFLPRVWPRSWS